MSSKLLWLDLETNTNIVGSNSVLELFAQLADWRECSSQQDVPAFYALMLPEPTLQLVEARPQDFSREEFIETLGMSEWCRTMFIQNGLVDALVDAARRFGANVRAHMSSDAVGPRFLEFIGVHCAPHGACVFAGKNIHYDMTVLARAFPAVQQSPFVAKHTYDVGTLFFVCNVVLKGALPAAVLPQATGAHRAVVDVLCTRQTNKLLLDALGVRSIDA
jgi:oligoribonuclease (3'-5' exoribonuclease)